MDESWLMPSWRTARPLEAADERFRQLFGDHGPAMNPGLVMEISALYIDALLRTSLPGWLRARLLGEKRRRRRTGWAERLRLRARVLSVKYLRRRNVASLHRTAGLR